MQYTKHFPSQSHKTCFLMAKSIHKIFITFLLIFTITIFSFIPFNKPTLTQVTIPQNTLKDPTFLLKVYIFDLPRSYNYGLLQSYWTLPKDPRISFDPDHPYGSTQNFDKMDFPPYPQNQVNKQLSAEYWLLGDLMTFENYRNGSFAKRVFDVNDADVIFVPFFAALSAEIQLSVDENLISKKIDRNLDYVRQKEVVDLVTNSAAWKRSGGRNFVFVLTDPVAMIHVQRDISPAILLVVDFGAWFKFEPRESYGKPLERFEHTHVSLLKDVIVPYNHLLPALHLSENQQRHSLLYFKGGKRRHRGGAVRAKLWDLLVNEPGVVMEEGRPIPSDIQRSLTGMRNSEFCLDPAGDTPTSCRLFDAIQSLCIPVIVSDRIELPFEGTIDYSELAIFVSVGNALQPKWLINYLNSISESQRDEYRKNMARVQPMFQYENEHPGGMGPISPDGAVNQIWKKIHQKVPMIKEAMIRDKRKPPGTSIPLRCHCT